MLFGKSEEIETPKEEVKEIEEIEEIEKVEEKPKRKKKSKKVKEIKEPKSEEKTEKTEKTDEELVKEYVRENGKGKAYNLKNPATFYSILKIVKGK